MKSQLPLLARAPRPEEPTVEELLLRNRIAEEEKRDDFMQMIIG